MKEKVKGKIFVGMIISILAFGLATGTSIVIGTNSLNNSGIMNITQQGQFPSIPFTPNNNVSNNQQVVNTSPTPSQSNSGQQVINPPANTPTNNNSNTNKSKTNNTK